MRHSFTRLIGAAFSIAIFTVGARSQEFTFTVEHGHTFKSCKGSLILNGEGVEYRTTHKDHARRWAFTDIKMFKLLSPKTVKLLTYESKRLRLGSDDTFEFKVTKGELSNEVSDFLLARIERPLTTSFVATKEKPLYELPARHRHTFGGDQGTLKVYTDGVIYESSRTESSRRWRWSDIQSISRTGPYRFSITTYEPKFGGPTKTFNFDLKERMYDAVYDYLWTRIWKPSLPASPEERQ